MGPADDGGLPIDAFVVQYKNNSQDTWEQSGKERVWVVGGHKSVAMHEPLIKPAGIYHLRFHYNRFKS